MGTAGGRHVSWLGAAVDFTFPCPIFQQTIDTHLSRAETLKQSFEFRAQNNSLRAQSSYPAADERFQRRLGKTLIEECTLRSLHFFAFATDVTRNEEKRRRLSARQVFD
jgi:hypothetical protein